MQDNTPTRIKLSEPQNAVFQARTPLILDMAGQGGGKTEMIGVMTALLITAFPQVKGFIGANTYMQLSQTTLEKTMATWLKYFGWDEYDKRENPHGFYVINKKPPPSFKRFTRLAKYHNTISFKNGCLVYVGSLDNYIAHDGKEFGWAHLDEVKDAKEEALTKVILARLRQMGIYFDPANNNNLVYSDDKEAAEAKGWVSFNPCYVHTSPSHSGVEWLLRLFKIDKDETAIRETLNNPYKYYFKVKENVTAVIYQTFWNEPNIPSNYIPNARLRMTVEEQDLFILGIPFVKTGNEFYNQFNRRTHVVPNIKPDFNKRFHITYDFNVMPYVTQIVSQVDNVFKFYNKETGEKVDYLEDWHVGFEPLEVTRIKILKEFCMRPPENETEQAADLLGQWLKLNNANCDLVVYGDGSGHNRITGMGSLTQYKIIKRILSKYFANEIAAKKSNISVLLRKKFLNKLFANKLPNLEIYIDASCTETIRDFEMLKQGINGKLKEKEKDPATGMMFEKIGHTSDAVDYLVCEIFKAYLRHID